MSMGMPAAAMGGEIPAPAEDNTILFGDLYSKEWRTILGAPTGDEATPNNEEYTDLDGNLRADGVRLNRRQSAANGARIAKEFVAPAGCTSVRLEVDAKLPAGFSNQTIVIGLYQLDGTTLIAKTSCVLTSSVQRFSVTGSVTPGTEYRAIVYVFNITEGTTTNATALVTRVRLVPIGTLSAPFNGDFLRLPIEPRLLHDNRISKYISRMTQASPFSRFVFRTRATVIALEYIRTYANSAVDPLVIVDGRAVGTVALSGSNALTITTFTLSAGLKTVEISYPPQNNGAAYPSDPSLSGAYLKAVYVPRDTYTQIIPPVGGQDRRLLIYGDSIASGFGTTRPSRSGVVTVLRRSYPGAVMLEAHGARSLAEDVATGSPGTVSSSKVLSFVRALAQFRPTDLWFCIGTNDYSAAYWAAAAFGTAYAAVMDEIRVQMPTARCWFQSPLTRSSEVANGLGSTLANYRTEISNACAARAWSTYVDGAAVLSYSSGSNGYYLDTVHPNENGHAAWAEYLRSTIGW